MKLQTNIPLSPQENQIDYKSKILLLGSCFVENIGDKLEYYKFRNLQNPFGILFQPTAIENLISRAIKEVPFTEDDIFYYNEQWHCFLVHSSLSSSDKEKFLNSLNKKRSQLLSYIKSATHIVFTFGTSWVYRNIASNSLVANCHKIPQIKFTKELLSVDEVAVSIRNTISLIKDINPKVNFITTISPVRHLKDGFVENNRSKAHLISGLQSVVDEASKKERSLSQVEVFPSYEIMMDELRDYRFYKEDMIHPNKTAISLIWNAFSEVWIADETRQLQKEIGIIQTGLSHKPFHSESKAHQKFLKDLGFKINSLQNKISHLKF